MTEYSPATALQQDAANRAWRSFLQGLGIDVLVALALVVYTVLDSAASWTALEWNIIGFTLLKTVLITAASYVMRRFMDPSKVPTPLPPATPGPPADADGDPAP